MLKLILYILFSISLDHLSSGQNVTIKPNIRQIPLDPFNSSDVLEIGLMILIIDLEPFVELNMDFKIDYLMKQVWYPHTNYCLALFDDLEISPLRKKPFKPIVLYDEVELNKIWLPDTFSANAKDERVSSDTEVLEMVLLSMLGEKTCIIEYWSKLNAKLSCSLNFKFYPFDKQYCNMTIRNYAIKKDILRYKWLGKNDVDWRGFKNDEKVFIADGVVLYYPLRLVQYDIEAFSNTFTDNLYFDFASLFVTFIYKRRIFGSIIEVYVPSTLLLLVSWSSLWIHVDEVGRPLNCMTCFLSLITQFIHVRSQLPVITYINGTDIWMLACLSFVFLNLLQFTIVKYLQQNIETQDQKNARKQSLTEDKALNAYLIERNRERLRMIKKLKSFSRDRNAAFKRVELIKYLAILKITGQNKSTVDSNRRLHFVDRSREMKKQFFLRSRLKQNEQPFEFDQNEDNNNYDRVLKDRIDKLVKYNSSSSSSSDSESESEENWYQELIKQNDYDVNELTIRKLDDISKFVFLFIFLAFNIVYWPYMIYSN